MPALATSPLPPCHSPDFLPPFAANTNRHPALLCPLLSTFDRPSRSIYHFPPSHSEPLSRLRCQVHRTVSASVDRQHSLLLTCTPPSASLLLRAPYITHHILHASHQMSACPSLKVTADAALCSNARPLCAYINDHASTVSRTLVCRPCDTPTPNIRLSSHYDVVLQARLHALIQPSNPSFVLQDSVQSPLHNASPTPKRCTASSSYLFGDSEAACSINDPRRRNGHQECVRSCLCSRHLTSTLPHFSGVFPMTPILPAMIDLAPDAAFKIFAVLPAPASSSNPPILTSNLESA